MSINTGSKRKLLFSGIGITLLSNLLLSLLAIISGSLIARMLGPEVRGEYAAIQTWAVFFALLANLGLSDAVVYFSSRDPDKSKTYLASAIVLLLIVSTIFSIVAYIFLPYLLASQPVSVINTARWFTVIYLFLQATQGMLLHPLRGRKDFLVWNLLRISYVVIWLFILGFIYFSQSINLNNVAFGYLLSLIIAGSIVSIVVTGRIPGKFRFSKSVWEPILIYGVPLAVSAIPNILNLRLDQMVMTVMLPSSLLGYYAIAVTWSGATAPIINSIGSVMFPSVASITSEFDKVESLSKTTRISSVIILIITITLLIITPIAIPIIFGQSYIPSIPSAMILVVASIPLSLNIILAEGFRGYGYTRGVLIGEIIGLLIMAISLIVLLPKYYIVGASLASLIGYLTTTITLVFLLSQKTGYSFDNFIIPQRRDFIDIYTRIKASF